MITVRTIAIGILCSLMFVTVNAEQYAEFIDVLEALTPKGGMRDEKELVLTKEQAKKINKQFNTDYDNKETFAIHQFMDDQYEITGYILRLKRVIEEYESEHDFIIHFDKNKSLLKSADLLELNDEYAELVKEDDTFFNQFKDVANVDSLVVGKTIDGVTEATMTCELTCETVKLAKYLLNLLKE